MNSEDADVLVTGANGFIGRWLLAALTARGRHVAALVRHAPQRKAELRAFVERLGGDPDRLHVISGDVESASLGLAGPWQSVRDVYHLAARFDFGLTPAEARRANVDGTLHTLAWAGARPQLRRFVYLGGYRMTRPPASLRNLVFPLSEGAKAHLYREHGAYEASKHESYAAFRDFVDRHTLPWTVVHPSGVIGDSRTGETTQLVGLGQTVERLWQGKLPALVGSTRTFVPVVAVDYLADVLATAPEREATLGQELTVLDADTPVLPDLIHGLASHLGVNAPKRVLPIGLVKRLPSALTGLDREALGFLSEDRYDTTAADAHAAAMQLGKPDLARSLARWCDELVSTRFGTEPTADRGQLRAGVFSVGYTATAEIVFLHGLPWNGDAWKPVADRLDSRSARLDLPGLGRSAPGHEDDVAFLDRVLAERTRPAVLVGHSVGAAMAVRYAHARPKEVAAIVLVSPAFLQQPAPLLMRCQAAVRHVLKRSTASALAGRLLPELAADAAELSAVRSAATDLGRAGVASRVAAALARASAKELRSELHMQLHELHCPVTIIHGERDPLVVAHSVDPASVHAVAGAGHALHLSRPDEVAALIGEAVRDLRKRDASTPSCDRSA